MTTQQLLKIVYALDVKFGCGDVHVVCGVCYYLVVY